MKRGGNGCMRLWPFAEPSQNRKRRKASPEQKGETMFNCSRMMIFIQEKDSLLMHFLADKRNPNKQTPHHLIGTSTRLHSCVSPIDVSGFSSPFSGLQFGATFATWMCLTTRRFWLFYLQSLTCLFLGITLLTLSQYPKPAKQVKRTSLFCSSRMKQSAHAL